MVNYKVKIGNVEYPFVRLQIVRNVKAPEEFEVVLPSIEKVNIGDRVDIYRNNLKIFSGLIEKKTACLGEDGLSLTVWGRDLSQKLFRKLTGQTTYVETKVKTILENLLTDTGLTVGEIEEPIPVWHKWFQTSDTDFSNDSLTRTKIEGSGEDAKIVLDPTPLLDSQQTDTSYGNDISGSRWRADDFTIQNYDGWITKVQLYLQSDGASTVTVSIRSSLTGSDLCSASKTVTSGGWYEFIFSSPTHVNKNETYYLVVRVTSGDIAYWSAGTSGTCWVSDDNGSTWTEISGNHAFKIFIQPDNGNIVSELIQPTNLVNFFRFNATTVLNGQTLTFDILDSVDNVLISGITPSQLPYSLESLTVSAIKVRANF
ncbi:MAG: hypothetical protein DRO36_02110 [Candidatus Hecatellales archaeon]|nr:MAG: hypothetical protein DRO36_02110 [Candidatus Hecatellales archaeon]